MSSFKLNGHYGAKNGSPPPKKIDNSRMGLPAFATNMITITAVLTITLSTTPPSKCA